MSSAAHHVCIAVEDPDQVLAFLEEAAGLELLHHFQLPGDALTVLLGWPPSDGTEGWMLGSGPAGLVELLLIPTALREVVRPGPCFVSFGTRSVADARERSMRFGPVTDVVPVVNSSVDLRAACVDVGGVRFEFCEYS